jgi:hypothetical protein
MKFYQLKIISVSILVGFSLFGCKDLNPRMSSLQDLIQYTEPKDSQFISLHPDIQVPLEDPGYTLVLPDMAIGMIVMFHSGRDTSHPGFEQRIYLDAVDQDVAIVYVTTGNPFEFLFSKTSFERLDRYIGKALKEADVKPNRLLFAGMSLAGTRALKFVQWCKQGKSDHDLSPLALAICDAPLDFNRFWKVGNFAILNNTHPTSKNEAQWVNYQLEKNLGGSPIDNPKKYIEYSPFSYSEKLDTKLAMMNDIFIRYYTEPDVNWWMKNRNRSYTGINSVDGAEWINQLNQTGHSNAELILTENKGVRPNGERHPHSWSIVDNKELIKWFVQIIHEMNNYE